MRVKYWIVLTAVIILFTTVSVHAQQEEKSPLDKIDWLEGPVTADLGILAEVNVPEGFVFAGGEDTRLIMEAMQNPVSGEELGFLAPQSSNWFLVFEFSEVGYVKDDEGDSLDADKMLKSLREGNEEANKERTKRGWATLTITGWEQPPRYNPQSNNLEWAIRGESDGHAVINWNTRLLGRSGVMGVTLVADPELLSEIQPDYQALLTGFNYKSGHRYAEFTKGRQDCRIWSHRPGGRWSHGRGGQNRFAEIFMEIPGHRFFGGSRLL